MKKNRRTVKIRYHRIKKTTLTPKEGDEEIRLQKRYSTLSPTERRLCREEYVKRQKGLCFYCKEPLKDTPPSRVRRRVIDWSLFPPNFLKYPVHLQHDHYSDMTEGAVHSLCNAVMWQYEGR